MPTLFATVLCTFVAVSLAGSLMVVIDKYNAINGQFRISEATLMFFGICGGAFWMLLIMRLIRHKIRSVKFMLSFPLLSALHIIILFLCYR